LYLKTDDDDDADSRVDVAAEDHDEMSRPTVTTEVKKGIYILY